MKNFYKGLDYDTSKALTGRFVEAIQKECKIDDETAFAVLVDDLAFLTNGTMAYHYNDNLIDLIGKRQLFAFFGKNIDVPLNVDREAAAFDKFIESEHICRNINRKFRALSRTGHSDPYVESVLFTAQRKIASILGSSDFIEGSFPSLSCLKMCFGPGSNVNVKKNTSARWKLSSIPACSTNMLSILPDVLSELPAICDFWKISESNDSWIVPVFLMDGELMFVAKNAKIDRSIIVEPSLNTLVQKGIGLFLKDRLQMFGINLFDQHVGRNSNRRRAMLASVDNSLMTIDLSSASDTIATEIVKSLLPFDWFSLMDSSRTTSVLYKKLDQKFELEKFSSMGNGFTFELETLIFYALTYAICEVEGVTPDISVYGDDIIAPRAIFEKLKYIFNEVGFSINDKKSYIDGPFRESCGGDYFLGQDIRPYYQKKNWSYADLFSFHNFLIRKGLNHLFPSLLSEVQMAIPNSIKIYGPDGFGDGHLLGDWKPIPYKADYGWGGAVFFTYVQSPRQLKKFLLPGDYILPFYSAYVFSGGGNHFAVRGSTFRCKKVRIYTLGR